METHILDATNKSFGRLASEVSLILQGKRKSNYLPYLDQGDEVKVKNIKEIKFTGKKFFQKVKHSYSGYPGGLKTRKFSELFSRDPGKMFKLAVYQMLPKNKLRKSMIQRLKFE